MVPHICLLEISLVVTNLEALIFCEYKLGAHRSRLTKNFLCLNVSVNGSHLWVQVRFQNSLQRNYMALLFSKPTIYKLQIKEKQLSNHQFPLK
jgi:hypothetical protein